MPKLEPLIKVYLGIDPGLSGGIAWFDPNTGGLTSMKMPPTLTDIWEAIQFSGIYNFPRHAIIEWINPAYIQTAKSANSKLYGNFFALQMACVAAGISYEIVMPRKWQQGLGITPGGKDKNQTKWKNSLKAKAQQLFPNERITLANSDAILIAEYCRRFHLGLL